APALPDIRARVSEIVPYADYKPPPQPMKASRPIAAFAGPSLFKSEKSAARSHSYLESLIRKLQNAAMSTSSLSARRVVHYASLDEFQADAKRLAGMKYRTLGQWTYPQILDHLSRTIVASIDGFGFQAPWFARKLIAPLVKNSFLTK